MYLLVNHVSGYIEKTNANKYLIFDDSVNENKPLLKKYADVWDRIKTKSKQKMVKRKWLRKDYTKIKFNFDDG